MTIASAKMEATTYATPPLCTNMWWSDAVFVGRVRSVGPSATQNPYGQRIVFEVREHFRGPQASVIRIDNDERPLEVGRMYLVFARLDKATQRLRLGIASGTKELREATSDLAALRRWVRVPPRDRIVVGWAGNLDHDHAPLPGFDFTPLAHLMFPNGLGRACRPISMAASKPVVYHPERT
jgi:hypothetical protein